MRSLKYISRLFGLIIASGLLLINVACYFASFFSNSHFSGTISMVLLFIMIIMFPFMFHKLMKGTGVQPPEKWNRVGFWGAIMHAPHAEKHLKIQTGLWFGILITIVIERFLPDGGRFFLIALMIPYHMNFVTALSSYYEFKENDMDDSYLA